MVRIIGVAPEELKNCICRNCASVLEYANSDLRKWSGRDYSGGSAGRTWIVCPKCNEEITINSW